MTANPDVVVIGSGAGGAACAWGLCRHGIRVLVLEAGPAYDPRRDYLLDQPQWEQQEFPHQPGGENRHSFGPMQLLDPARSGLRSWNHITGPMNRSAHRLAWKYHHVLGVGGTTLGYAAEAHRMHPEAMQMATRFGVAADWPLQYAELEPYYCEAERLTGVAGPRRDPQRPRSQPYPLPAHRLSYASKKIGEGCRRLGLSWVANSVAINSRRYDHRPPCNYCGNCARGCPKSDKGSADVTFLRKAIASGYCRVQPRCRVTRIEAGAADRVEAVYYLDPQGAQQRVRPRAVVVACGAVETPRLLLLSRNAHAANGLGNESGQVGRNFMETLSWASSGLFPEPLASHRGIPVDSVCWDFNAPDRTPGLIGGYRCMPMVLEAHLNGPINYAQRVVAGWGRAHKERMREEFGRVLAVGAVGESLPSAAAHVDLDPGRVDGRGDPLARIHSHLGATEIARLEIMAARCREILEASGVDGIFEEYGTYDVFSSTHVFGTCRMGDDPNRSVVDRHGGSHRWRNLFVTDNSVFPSSGGGEAPTLTIQALAIRSADHIRDRFAGKEL